MPSTHVDGKTCGKILIYALSTCIWCKKTKHFFNLQGLEYDYIDVDLLDPIERDRIDKEIEKWNPAISFPTIIIDDQTCIRGYDPEMIKEHLQL